MEFSLSSTPTYLNTCDANPTTSKQDLTCGRTKQQNTHEKSMRAFRGWLLALLYLKEWERAKHFRYPFAHCWFHIHLILQGVYKLTKAVPRITFP